MKITFFSLSLICFTTVTAQPPPPSPATPAREAKPAVKLRRLEYTGAVEDKGASKLLDFERSKAGRPESATYSSLDQIDPGDNPESLPKGIIKFEQAEVGLVLKFYQELSGRTVIYPSSLPAVKVSIENETPLTRREALQALDTVLAENGVTMVLLGTKFVKAVPSAQAPNEAGPVIELPPDRLPESSSYMTYIVRMKNREATEVVQALQPFASRLPQSILVIRDPGLVILRDYSVNIRRMLKIIQEIDQAPSARHDER